MPDEVKLVEVESILTEPLFRTYEINRQSIDDEKRTVELSFSSEEPVERWFGTEILDHKTESVRLDRLNSVGPLLLDHTPTFENHVGNIISAKIDTKERKGRALVRVADDRDDVFQRIKDGTCRCVSVGYRIHELELMPKTSDEDPDVYRATDWEPMEVSLVSIPADATVGVGRKADPKSETGYSIRVYKPEIKAMPDPVKEKPKDKAIEVVATGPTQAERDAVISTERTRISKITKEAARHGKQALGLTAIEEGHDLARFCTDLLDSLPGATRIEPGKAGPSPQVGLTEKEKGQYSFMRMLRAQAFGHKTPKMIEAAKFEFECSRAQAEISGVEPKGYLVPTDVLLYDRPKGNQDRYVIEALARVLTQGGATTGADLIATNLLASNFIDLLRNNSILPQLGITILDGLVGDIAIPRQTGAGTAFWLATDETDITESTQALDQVTMIPRNVGALSVYTRQLLLQSSLSIEAFVRADIASILGLALDLAGLYGSGASGQPTGIANTSGINAPTNFAGANPTFAEVIAMETPIATSNALFGNLSYISEPVMRGALKTTEKASGTAQFVWENGELNGYKAHVTTQVTAGDLFFGNFADLIQGLWGGLDVLVDPFTLSARMNTRVIAMLTADYAVRHPLSFSFNNDGV